MKNTHRHTYDLISAALSDEVLENLCTKFYENPLNRLVQNMCISHDPLEICKSHSRIREAEHIFTHKVSL